MDLYKDLIFDTIMEAAVKKLIVRFPAFGMFPLNLFLSWFASHLAEAFYVVMKSLNVTFENARLRQEFDNSSVALKIIATEKGIESDEFKEARQKHKQKLSEFARLTIFK